MGVLCKRTEAKMRLVIHSSGAEFVHSRHKFITGRVSGVGESIYLAPL